MKMKNNLKFLLSIILLSLLGATLGILGSIFSLDLIVYNFFMAIGEFINKNIFVIFLVLVLSLNLLTLIFYLLGKKQIKADLNKEDYDINDKFLVYSITLGSVSMMLSFALFMNAIKLLLTLENTMYKIFIVGIVFILTIIYLSFMQKNQMRLIKSYNPEKYDNILDLKFEKKYMDSLDEREKLQAYKAGFVAYKTMSKVLFFLLVFVGIISMTTSLSIFPIHLIAFVAIAGLLSYVKESLFSK